MKALMIQTSRLFVRFAHSAVVESEEVAPDLVVDYDAEGTIVGIEILSATERLGKGFAGPGVAA
ncbi:DUF2283 domain-containing protein [Beijerinckia sp. L45]|uniref:DUF2283 domain-containing protein n=1 Tax=Beijerinckia sp. L45 TaxID=1641855 RepID=UPI001FEE40BA|nr:DUF2283 domain-containing protein [Beijerinckia sp. L45]